jgi:hypothetical protein
MIPKDKLYHAGAGAVIAAAVILFTKTPAFGFLAATIAGVAKEQWDRYQIIRSLKDGKTPQHAVDPKDIVWTMVGGALGVLLLHFAGL